MDRKPQLFKQNTDGDVVVDKEPVQPAESLLPVPSGQSSLSQADLMTLEDENPEEFGLIKCTKIISGTAGSTNNTENFINTNDSQEEEKKEEVSNFASDVVSEIKAAAEGQANEEKGLTVSEIFKQRLTNYSKTMKKTMAFADQMDQRHP